MNSSSIFRWDIGTFPCDAWRPSDGLDDDVKLRRNFSQRLLLTLNFTLSLFLKTRKVIALNYVVGVISLNILKISKMSE